MCCSPSCQAGNTLYPSRTLHDLFPPPLQYGRCAKSLGWSKPDLGLCAPEKIKDSLQPGRWDARVTPPTSPGKERRVGESSCALLGKEGTLHDTRCAGKAGATLPLMIFFEASCLLCTKQSFLLSLWIFTFFSSFTQNEKSFCYGQYAPPCLFSFILFSRFDVLCPCKE